MRRTLGIVAAFFLVAALVYEFGLVAICDGFYDLSVTVKSLSSSPIRSVSCEGFRTTKDAQLSLAYLLPPETHTYSASADPFTGEPLIVLLPLSFKESPLGRTWGDFQFRGLLVIVEYQDGRRVGNAVEIPHRRESRSVTVEVP
jgi:hypothetical protein